MRLGKYTYDVRNLGQAESAHKVDANVRASKEPTEKIFFGRERSDARASATYAINDSRKGNLSLIAE